MKHQLESKQYMHFGDTLQKYLHHLIFFYMKICVDGTCTSPYTNIWLFELLKNI